MTDKEIIIDGVDVSECEHQYYKKCKIDYEEWNNEIIRYNECQNNPNCHFKQLKRKEQECERWKKANDEKNELLAKMGCPTVATAKRNVFTLQQQLDQLKAENEELRRSMTKIFACLIKANRTNKIVDTLWVDSITTLWDYIALTLGIEGDQTQIEEQILQKISEYKGEYNEKIR